MRGCEESVFKRQTWGGYRRRDTKGTWDGTCDCLRSTGALCSKGREGEGDLNPSGCVCVCTRGCKGNEKRGTSQGMGRRVLEVLACWIELSRRRGLGKAPLGWHGVHHGTIRWHERARTETTQRGAAARVASARASERPDHAFAGGNKRRQVSQRLVCCWRRRWRAAAAAAAAVAAVWSGHGGQGCAGGFGAGVAQGSQGPVAGNVLRQGCRQFVLFQQAATAGSSSGSGSGGTAATSLSAAAATEQHPPDPTCSGRLKRLGVPGGEVSSSATARSLSRLATASGCGQREEGWSRNDGWAPRTWWGGTKAPS